MSTPKKQKNKSRGTKSSYCKYTCQYKNKPILTKLNNDSGYPQQILNPSDYAGSKEKFNYVQQNKKNLKNFFQERIPIENTLLKKLMKREIEMIHPKRIFEMKQKQNQLKSKTKMNLTQQFQAELEVEKKYNFQKVNANFQINDKTKQLKELYGGNKMSLSFYEDGNFRRGTHSHIGKRSKILKKVAYDNVFGPDISSLSRTAILTKAQVGFSAREARTQSISLKKNEQQKKQHKALRNLIGKMNDYKNKLQDKNEPCEMPSYDESSTKQYEENMVTMIQNMSKLYQGRNIVQGRHVLQKVQDLCKINKDFYLQMINHKNNRLNKRNQMIFQTVAPTEKLLEVSPRKWNQQLNLCIQNQSMFSFQEIEQDKSLEDNFNVKFSSGQVHTVSYRFKLLKKTLVHWAALFYIYGIQKNDIFIAFRSNKQPYELEGSYAFFKCIKMGDLRSVQNFVKKNRDYIFECQFYGKSPLSYACINNQNEIGQFLLGLGVNSDKKCNNQKTSLYYALQRRNVELVKAILQRGGNPWSSPENPYSKIVEKGENITQLSNLLNNARKIYLGMQIQSSIVKRKQFWDKYRTKIVQDKWIRYNSHDLY